LNARRISLYVVFLAFALILEFWNLSRIPLFEPDEGRYGDIALTMVKTGDWLTPKMNYLIHLHKPPLSSWAVATSFKIFGPSEFSARLPGVLLGLIIFLGMIRLGQFLFNFETGIAGAWILLTSTLFLVVTRLLTTDIYLCFFMFLAMYAFAHLFFGDRHRLAYFYLGMLSMGFGMLTKGPVAWMITIIPFLAFALWKRKRLNIPLKHWLLASVLFLIISFGWYLLVMLRQPGLLNYFLNYQLMQRIGKGAAGRAHPFYYYLIVLPLGFLPWTVAMPAVLAWFTGRKNVSKEETDKFHFLAVCFIIPFILFSIFRTKLATYIVPLFPPMALMAARFWYGLSHKAIPVNRLIRGTGWVMAAIQILMACGGIIFISLRPKFIEGIHPFYIKAMIGVLIAAALAMAIVMFKGKLEWLFRTQVASLILMSIVGFTALPDIRYLNTKNFCEKILRLRHPGEIVMMYERYFSSPPFYLGERILSVGLPLRETFETKDELKGFIIEDKGAIRGLIAGTKRIFILTNQDGYERINSLSRGPIYILLKQNKILLLSNRPET